MERHEIIEAFGEWSIPVSLNNLEHPTSDFVTTIYSACLQRIRSLTQADLEQPLQAALAQVENPVRLMFASPPTKAQDVHSGPILCRTVAQHTILPFVRRHLPNENTTQVVAGNVSHGQLKSPTSASRTCPLLTRNEQEAIYLLSSTSSSSQNSAQTSSWAFETSLHV